MHNQPSPNDAAHHTHSLGKPQGSYRSYIIGFLFSLAATLIAYFLVITHALPKNMLDFAVVTLCVIQLVIQLIYFLHLGEESKPYWNLLIFSFMMLVMIILIAGSLWILYDLNYREGM